MKSKLALVALTVVFAVLSFSTHQASAAYCDQGGAGLAGCIGYFTGGSARALADHDQGTVFPAISSGVYVNSGASDPAGDFIDIVEGAVKSGGVKGIGGAMIIDVMLGYGPYNYTNGTDGIATAKSHFTEFENLVRAYDAAPTGYGIYWNTLADTGTNSAYFSAIGDDAFHTNYDGSVSSIDFYYPGGDFYIQRSCGNLLGSTQLPPPAVWSLAGTASLKDPPIKQPGDSAPFIFHVDKTGTATSSSVTISDEKTQSWSGNFHTDTHTFGTNWTDTRTLTIPTTAKPGQKYCARVIYTPWKSGTTATGYSPEACYTIGSTPVPSSSCPALPASTDISKVKVGFTSEPSDSPPPSPQDGDTYATRTSTGHKILSATDFYTGGSLPYDNTNFTIDFTTPVTQYPYDSNKANYSYVNYYTLNVYTYHVDPVTKIGTWTVKSTNETSGTHYSNVSLGECYYRDFTVQSPPQTDVTKVSLSPTYEDPTQATFNSVVAVRFDLNGAAAPNPIRNPMLVNGLTYSGTFYIRHANGSIVTLSSSSKSISVGSTSTSGSTVTASFNSPTFPPSLSVQTGFGPTKLQAGDSVCEDFTITYGSGQIDENGTIQSGDGSVGSSTSTNCSNPVVNEPFFKAFNSNVSAGGDFETATSCAAGAGTITGYFNNLGANKFGASSDLSALALGPVTGFGSKMFNSSQTPYGRTFANTAPTTTDAASPLLGGNFATGDHCLPAFKVTRIDHNISVDGQIQLTPGNEGVFVASNGGNPLVTRKIELRGSPQKITKDTVVYVDGDIYIGSSSGDSDLVLDPTKFGPNMPSLTVIANGGNIYIDKSVTTLDGIYVAQKVGTTGGSIFTCFDNGNASLGDEHPVSTTNEYTSCSNQLVVHGAFLASKVNLLRTYGSLRDEKSGTPLQCSNGLLAALIENRKTCGAEVFDFSPELYLGHQPATSIDFKGSTYDAITSLPPVL